MLVPALGPVQGHALQSGGGGQGTRLHRAQAVGPQFPQLVQALQGAGTQGVFPPAVPAGQGQLFQVGHPRQDAGSQQFPGIVRALRGVGLHHQFPHLAEGAEFDFNQRGSGPHYLQAADAVQPGPAAPLPLQMALSYGQFGDGR